MSMDAAQGQGSLERLGIPLETLPGEGVITPGSAKSLRFRVSRPEGYAYADVESFIFEILIPSLDWYAQTLHARDLAIHKLGEELDKAEVDIINLKAQIENADLNNSLGMSVANNDADQEVSRLIGRITTLEAELDAARQGIVSTPSDIESYSREEVEGYINEAVEQARAEEKARNITALAAARQGTFSQADIDAAVAAALASAPEPEETVSLEGFYTYEEVQQYIDEAVLTARAEEQQVAKQNGYTAEDLEAAVASAEADARKGLYTQADVEAAVTEALANVPQPPVVDPDEELISTLTDEPDDMRFRAESAALREKYDEMLKYVEELEAYIAQIQGVEPESTRAQEETPKNNLPPITAEDLM